MMTFAGPFSPRFTADTLVVSENVGEGGPAGEALRFPCEFVDIAKGLWDRDFSIWERVGPCDLDGGGEKRRREDREGFCGMSQLGIGLELLLGRSPA